MSSASPFQNPKNQAPENILSELRTIAVQHYGFDEKIHEGEIILNVELKDDVRELFEYSLRLKFPIFSVIPIHKPPFCFNDQMSCEANNSSGFNYRTIHNTNTLSKHSLGIAFDINPVQNIYITYDLNDRETYRLPKTGMYEVHKPGTLTKNHPLVIFMKKRGWTWGGDWTKESGRIDYQHFEKI